MSGVVLILIGLVLGFVGVRSLKLSMALVGFAAGWFLADVFDSSATTDLLIGLAGAVTLFLLTLFAARLIFWLLGAVTGVVVGAKLFFVVDQGDSSLVLALSSSRPWRWPAPSWPRGCVTGSCAGPRRPPAQHSLSAGWDWSHHRPWAFSATPTSRAPRRPRS